MKKLLMAVAVAGLAFGAFAADEQDYTQWVTLTNSDYYTNSKIYVYSFASKSAVNYWSDGAWPSKDKDYYVPSGKSLYTTTTGNGHMAFAGRHLALAGMVLFRSNGGYNFSMGPGGILLPDGKIRFNSSNGTLQDSISVESTVENPANLQLNTTLSADGSRGLFNINAAFSGEACTAIRLYRSTVQSVLPVPDSTFLVKKAAFANYFGTVRVTKNVEFLFDGSFANQTVPGTLQLDPDGYFTVGTDNGAITVGTLAAAGGVLRVNTSPTGETNPPVVTNALTFVDDAKLTVTFGTWAPKPGVQKYPILKLTGAAADSDVTADDFILDITSPMWRDLPKTDNPRIAIDVTEDGKVVSVEWPDEPAPYVYLDENGNVVLDAATQYGNFIDDITDGETGSRSVIKQGEGAAQVGPNSPFTGTIDVRKGKLIVGNRDWEYYRWVIQSTFNTTAYDASQDQPAQCFGLRSFALYDADGNDRVYRLSDEGDWGVLSSYYGSFAYTTPIEPGHFRVTDYNGNQKSYRGLINAKNGTISKATNIFAHVAWGYPIMQSDTLQKHPCVDHTNTWAVLTMRPLPGAPITSWDYVNLRYQNKDTDPTVTRPQAQISHCQLEVSMDCKNWTVIDTVVNAKQPTNNTWQGDGATFVEGYETRTSGMPLDSQYPADPILFAATKVSVAEGATLEAHTGTAPVLNDLEVDLDKGLGTIKGFAFAATGTLRITNTYGLRDIRIAADLSGVAGYENLANWTILIDGKEKTRSRIVTVTTEGIAISPKGLVIIVGSNAGGASASLFLSPTDGAVVPLLNARQKEFLTWTPNEICEAISNEVARKAAGETIPNSELLEKIGTGPLAVDFRWRPGLGKVLLTVAKKGAETTPFFRDYVTEGAVSLKNFEVGARYVATLKGMTVDETIEFETEDLAPRCIALSGRTNTRDLGGRTLPNGRRVRQGLMYRTGEFETDGKMRISEETRKYIVETLGVKTDIDLRQDSVVQPIVDAGRVSPLGPTVEWIHEWENYYGYQAVHTTGADATKRIFRYFGDRTKYPIVFHCAGGADRTGTVAFLLQGVLGASDDQILKDYLVTGWGAAIIGNNYPKWLWQTVRSFDGFEGETLSARICAYFKETLGFTEAELDAIRDIMLED